MNSPAAVDRSVLVLNALLGAGLLWPSLARRASEKALLLAGLLADLASMALLIVSWLVVHQHAAAFGLLLGATACLGAGFGLSVPSLNTLAAALHPAAPPGHSWAAVLSDNHHRA